MKTPWALIKERKKNKVILDDDRTIIKTLLEKIDNRINGIQKNLDRAYNEQRCLDDDEDFFVGGEFIHIKGHVSDIRRIVEKLTDKGEAK